MQSHVLGSCIDFDDSYSQVTKGAGKAVFKDGTSATQPPTSIELDTLEWGKKLNGPHGIGRVPENSISKQDIESSVPSTPIASHGTEAIVQSLTNPPRNRWRLAAAAITFLMMGMNDSATGALIPYLELHYNVGYAIVSTIFIGNALGFILAAPFVQLTETRLGRSKSYILAFGLTTLAYIALVCDPPFPVVVIAFFVSGYGYATFLAMTNSWVVNLLNGTTILGSMHAFYGLGGVIAPLIATALVSKGVRWSAFYFIPLGISVFTIFSMSWCFRGYEQDSPVTLLTELEKTASQQLAHGTVQPKKKTALRKAASNRTTLLGSIFIFAYQGAEVAISGWVISFLIHFRKGDPAKVGNVTSGFWGGITLGRFALTHFCHRIGEKTSVYFLVLAAAVFQLLVWLIPNIIGNAVAEAIVGLCLGPVYPCATAVFSKLIPRNMQITSLGIVASL